MGTFHIQQEGPVNALALNRDNTQVAIGGRNVFKVYAIEENKFREVCNLRATKHLNLGFSCNDVAWSPLDDQYLATAATNGHVCVWNLTKMGRAMQEQDYQDHKRTVNKVNFHTSDAYKLISGSQDGTMRYFDIRLNEAVSIFYSNTESVRDVQFSPHNPYTFAAVSDNGSVQIWDIRKPDRLQQQYTAHSGPVFACDWHPESSWLATASRDKTIKVWDLQTSKPTLEYTIHTIAAIGHVKWRPQRKYHIASCALVIDCSINIWDVRRPYIPFASFNEHRDIASGVAWKGDPHVFLSSGRDCTLYQHLFNDASRPASKANPHGISFNKEGEILFAQKVQTNNFASTPSTNALTKATNLMRKISTTQSFDTFHQASSTLQQFMASNHHDHLSESELFVKLAKNYILTGRSVSEMCEHNAAVAREYGKSYMSVIWKIIKTIYGEEFMQNSVNFEKYDGFDTFDGKKEDENESPEENDKPDSPVMELDEEIVETDQASLGGDTPMAQFSGGDESGETENEDQVDHAGVYSNGFPNYLNYRSGLPKGDFSFGENELDMEIDGISTEYQNGFKSYNQITPQELKDADYCAFPSEAFPLRHEIMDRSPPPEQFPNRLSPELPEEPLPAIIEEPQPLHMLRVKKPKKKSAWDPSQLVIDALKYHADMGDVQSAACILIVIGDNRKYLEKLDEYTQEFWLLSYIEHLNRYKLWNEAAQVIKLSWLPSVFSLNQQSTRINTNCNKCSKPLQRTGWLCDRCHSSESSLCSICHQVVKGLYAWCQGCSHGGHVAHIKQWFSMNIKCPTGCGHSCEFG
ncbi:GATOR complex protein WDR24 isoform X2 [Aethina tumida]|uniref:GATOR complex protein WDR24 isoform X2 n=1 Tax=Aethina tumida TaxID=116153 RepID=UPI002147B7EF|nr:GATOR complex protein WDR24 isoform X2 [Aethina tumida]